MSEIDSAAVQDPAAATGARGVSAASLFAVTDEAAWMIGQVIRRWTASPDVAAALAEVTSGVLAAVAAAQYASVAWACGRWLTGQAPTHRSVAGLDALQAELGQGPCLDALREQHTVVIPDMGAEARWPVFAARAAELNVGSMVSLPLSVRQEGLGVLNIYSSRPRAFTGGDEIIGSVFAARAAIALYQAAERDHLRALASRDMIGHATGVLMERHHLTAAAAFERLALAAQGADLTLAEVARWLLDEHIPDFSPQPLAPTAAPVGPGSGHGDDPGVDLWPTRRRRDGGEHGRGARQRRGVHAHHG